MINAQQAGGEADGEGSVWMSDLLLPQNHVKTANSCFDSFMRNCIITVIKYKKYKLSISKYIVPKPKVGNHAF